MEQRIQHLEQQLKQLKLIVVTTVSLLLLVLVAAFSGKVPANNIIRAKGIVIEDEQGRDRILIGAPLPASQHRVRTDSNLVRKYWAATGADSNEYMQWYKAYRHHGNGIAILSEQGFDKVLLGDSLPDPNTGKRMFSSTGMLWNDDLGYERGGIGVNKTTDGKYRSVVGLDDESGEAVHLFTLEDGTKALRIAGTNGYLMIGLSQQASALLQTKQPFAGIQYFNNKGKLVWQQAMHQQNNK